MPNYYVPLTAPNAGGGLNFEPINSAIDSIQQQNNINRAYDFQQKQFDATQQQRQFENARATKQDQLAEIEAYGKRATAVDQLTDPNQRAAAWKTILARHGTDGLTPEELDPVTGPKLMAAQAGQFLDPLKRQTEEANLALLRAQTTSANQKNTLNEAIAGLITGSPGASGSPSPAPSAAAPQSGPSVPIPQPRVQPQSYNAPPTMPGVVLASDTTTVPGAPAPAAQPSQDLVDTPLGPMTPQRARSIGFGLAIAGKDAAGKAFMDAGTSESLGKQGENQNDKEELGATGQLATLNSIKQSYNSKYLNIPTRFSLWGTALKDKFGALSDADKKDLQGYATFRQASWHNLNRVLKDLSGTAVTENEMQRQLLDLPNPGQGVFDGDAPAEFEAKLKGSIAFAQSAIARARFLRSKGFAGKPWESGVNVEDMPAIINQRGQEIEDQLRQSNPNASPMQLQQATTRQIKREFGI